MPQKKRALGRGLEALLPQKANITTGQSTAVEPVEASAGPVAVLPIAKIFRNEDQPRLTFDPQAMEDLADSIRRHGVIQPIAVMPAKNGCYVIVAGERRWRAAQDVGLEELPAIILQELSSQDLMQFALVENLQREDLRPMDEAKAFHSLQTKFGLTADDIAERVGKSRSAVANSLRLLNLRQDMQDDVDEGRITAGHARAILSLEHIRDQMRLRDMIFQDNLSVRQAEDRAREMIEGGASRRGRAHTSASGSSRKIHGSERIQQLREKLVDTLALRVSISTTSETSGRIELYYDSLDDLQRLLDALDIQV